MSLRTWDANDDLHKFRGSLRRLHTRGRGDSGSDDHGSTGLGQRDSPSLHTPDHLCSSMLPLEKISFEFYLKDLVVRPLRTVLEK